MAFPSNFVGTTWSLVQKFAQGSSYKNGLLLLNFPSISILVYSRAAALETTSLVQISSDGITWTNFDFLSQFGQIQNVFYLSSKQTTVVSFTNGTTVYSRDFFGNQQWNMMPCPSHLCFPIFSLMPGPMASAGIPFVAVNTADFIYEPDF